MFWKRHWRSVIAYFMIDNAVGCIHFHAGTLSLSSGLLNFSDSLAVTRATMMLYECEIVDVVSKNIISR